MADVFGVQVVFSCNGEAGSRYHHGRNVPHVLDQCDSCSSCAAMNCPPVPLGLDDEKWLVVTSLKDADVDLASHLRFFSKQFDVVFDSNRGGGHSVRKRCRTAFSYWVGV